MPIKGISEIRRLPRVGKIRLGIKATSERTKQEYPKQVDYFVVKEDGGITSEAMAQAFHSVYGDQPRELDILFPMDDPETIFRQSRRRYGSGAGLLCRGDGETAIELDRETGEMVDIECAGEDCEWSKERHCKPIGTLMFLLPKVPGLGCWQLDTSSFNSIVQVNSALAFIRGITDGRIAMIPLKLTIGPKEVSPGGKKKTVWVLDVQMRHLSFEQVLSAAETPITAQLMPPDTTDQIPDDLYPRSMQETGEADAPMGDPDLVRICACGHSLLSHETRTTECDVEGCSCSGFDEGGDDDFIAAAQEEFPQAVIVERPMSEIEGLSVELQEYLEGELQLSAEEVGDWMDKWTQGPKTRERLDKAKGVIREKIKGRGE